MKKLTGRTALVTGASRGIGRATALALARAGAYVIVHFARGETEALAVVEEIRTTGGKADVLAADLADADGAQVLAEKTRVLVGDRLDVLVANAAATGPATQRSIEEETIENFDRMVAINFRAPFFLVQQLSPLFGDGSSIVLTSSLVARTTLGVMPVYAATKAAVESLVRHFAVLLGDRGIRVNAVAPGVIATEATANYVAEEGGSSFVLSGQALKRIGQPDDVADVIAFLAGDSARWITGGTIQVGGGSKL
jgi:NAD(P)-dependent dehydrogenase (short-subunit alcohol dehydrogenase family)